MMIRFWLKLTSTRTHGGLAASITPPAYRCPLLFALKATA
jgi:hypothetical protein